MANRGDPMTFPSEQAGDWLPGDPKNLSLKQGIEGLAALPLVEPEPYTLTGCS
jgi:hypothetical protein